MITRDASGYYAVTCAVCQNHTSTPQPTRLMARSAAGHSGWIVVGQQDVCPWCKEERQHDR